MRTRATFSFILGPLVIVTVMAGCTTTSAPADSVVVIEGQACVRGADYCTMVGGTLLVSGLLIGRDAGIGIQVTGLNVPLRIENAKISSYETGILIDGACGNCYISVSNVTVYTAKSGLVTSGAFVQELRIQDSTITIGGADRGASAHSSSGTGVVVGASTERLVMNNVGLHGSNRGGTAMQGQSPGSLVLADIAIEGFDWGAAGRWRDVSMHDVEVDCGIGGIAANHATEVRLVRVQVTKCSSTDAYAIGLGAIGIKGTEAALQDVVIHDAVLGIHLAGFQTASLTRVTATQNAQVGVFAAAGNITMDGSRVADNGIWGAFFEVTNKLHITNSEIRDNGYISGLTNDNGGITILASADGDFVVRNSHISSNRVWGLIAPNLDVTVDARENWWGSALGPSPPTPEAVGNPELPGFGDSFYGVIQTEPHLIAPP